MTTNNTVRKIVHSTTIQQQSTTYTLIYAKVVVILLH